MKVFGQRTSKSVWLFGQEARKREQERGPGDVMVLFGQEARKRDAPGGVIVCLIGQQARR